MTHPIIPDLSKTEEKLDELNHSISKLNENIESFNKQSTRQTYYMLAFTGLLFVAALLQLVVTVVSIGEPLGITIFMMGVIAGGFVFGSKMTINFFKEEIIDHKDNE